MGLTVLFAAAGSFATSWAKPASAREAGSPGAAAIVNVFAAASLTGAFERLAADFERAHSGTKVRLDFAGSQTLARQIVEGAPADVFAASDETSMQRIVAAGAVAGEPRVFARNALQIAVSPGNPRGIAILGDLAKPGLTIALCGPTAPCGRYTAEAFAKAGIALPSASQELDVKAVLSKVALGEADAGIVYVTDVRAAGGRVAGVEIPESFNVVARYPLAVLAHSSHRAAAEAFAEHVVSAAGRQVLASFGFLPPGPR
jgi:molybdate transport system substrate-binding protein